MTGFRPRFFVAPALPESSSTESQVADIGALGEGSEVTLDPRDAHHAQRVLRLKADDPCEVVVGESVYAAHVSSTKGSVKVVLGERLGGTEAGAVYRSRVGLVQALTRPALVDQVLEKATEVGASFFVLVRAVGSTRLPEAAMNSRVDRWRRIAVEAAKQSKQSVVPTVDLVDSFEAARDRLVAEAIHSVVLEPGAVASLAESLERPRDRRADHEYPAGGAAAMPLGGIALWSGPESGWTARELEWFTAAGMQTARLGQSILRAETAGPVAVAVTRLIIGDW